MRRIAGIRATVAPGIVCQELSVQWQQDVWLSRMATFWNNQVSLAEGSLFKRVLCDNMSCFRDLRVQNWSQSFERQLQNITQGARLTFECVDKRYLRDCLDTRLQSHFEGLDICPRLCATERASFCIYHRYFSRPKGHKTHFLNIPVLIH